MRLPWPWFLGLVLAAGCDSSPGNVADDLSVAMELAAPARDLSTGDLTPYEARCAPGQPGGLCEGAACESGCRCYQPYSDGGQPQPFAICDCSARTATNPGQYQCCDGVWCEGMGSIAPLCDDPTEGPGCHPGFL